MFINANTFKGFGMQHLNGAQIKPALDKEKNHLKGASGNTMGYDLVTGGRVFLTKEQIVNTESSGS